MARRLTFVLIGIWQRWECSRCGFLVDDAGLDSHALSHGAVSWSTLGRR